MKDFAWTIPHNITLHGQYNFNNQQFVFSQIMLPLSIASLLTFSKFNFQIQTRIIQFSPLKLTNCKVSSSASPFYLETHSDLFIDRTEFNKFSKSIRSINAPIASLTHCSFNEIKTIPFFSEGTKKVKIKWNNFQDIENDRSISIKKVDHAIIETNNFTNLDLGAITALSSNVAIRGCLFDTNSGLNGGSIEFSQSNSNISFCSFSCGDSDKGGAIYSDFCHIKIDYCLFTQNIAALGSSIFTNSELSISRSNFSENRQIEIYGPSQIYYSQFNYKDVHVKFGPPPTATFSPSPSQSALPKYEEKYVNPKKRNTTLIIGLCCGIAGGIILIVVVFLIIVHVKAVNNPKIYVAEGTSDKKPPNGTTYIVSTNSKQ